MTAPASSLRAYRPDLADALEALGAPSFRHAQVYRHLTRHPGASFSEATDLPLELRGRLEPLGTSTLKQADRQDDPDGTTKLLLAATSDGQTLETVVMRYSRRTTVCVSTQVGCPLACTFCATGSIGFVRDLTAAEIVDQVRAAVSLVAPEGRTVSNVVYMGMGEPLLNLENVLISLRLLKDADGLDFAARSLSVSTIGIPEAIRRLGREEPQVNLALSLHAPDEKLRSELIPANRRYPLKEVLRAAADHFARTHRKLFVEYLLLDGINDSPQQAAELADLLRGRVVAVNLIPWNPAVGGFRPSSAAAAVTFRKVLAARGMEVSLRESRGARIAAACGQLVAGKSARRPPRPNERAPRGGRATPPSIDGRGTSRQRPDEARRTSPTEASSPKSRKPSPGPSAKRRKRA